ncbi:hypothetical protein TD95_002065 [Thielaviopsis punctulata]|uniref:Major facilitator superfamily (MFS) profile domain-containing protein n=1 Tax=Thielaviopsis punctulata TaxID=72032 RepID=A0A0F4ZFF5_9PEZI|nr:hypothetical protein TD95_002065 [Thielaviopsis punctulata]
MVANYDTDRYDTDCPTLVPPSPYTEDMPSHPAIFSKPDANFAIPKAADHGSTPPPEPASEKQPAVEGDGIDYPEGGFRAWVQVFACLLINSLSWGIPGMFGIYQLHYTAELGLPESQISWIGSIQTFLAFFICTISGRLTDAGYYHEAIVTGSVLTVLGLFMTSLATKYWQILLAQGLCTGLGLGIIFMPGMTVVTQYFKKRRSLALALSAMGTGVGSLIYPAILQYSMPHIGFPWAVRCTAFVALVFSVTATVLLRPRLPPRKSGPLLELNAFREPSYVLFSCGVFFLFWAMFFNFFYITGYAKTVIGLSSKQSTSVLMIAQAFTIPSRPMSGFIADRWLGPLNTFIVMVVYLSIMAYVWIGVKTATGMYVFSVFFGIALGASQGMFIGALASLTADPQKMGTRVGMVYAILGVAGLTGTPVSGAIIDQMDGKYWGAQLWAATCFLLAAVFVVAARYHKTGLQLRCKV